jgi:outer membrane protein assembly factor BamB
MGLLGRAAQSGPGEWRQRLWLAAALLVAGLSGTVRAQAPPVTLTPAVLTYADRLVGSTSAPQSAVLTNTGAAPLTITGMEISGYSYLSFAIASGGEPGTLASGQSRIIRLTFTPNQAGNHTANLIVNTDAAGSPHQLLLNGGGTTPAPAAGLSPNPLDFGAVPVGATSAARRVTLQNTGNGTLSVASISVAGADASRFAITDGAGSGTLVPGASRGITLTFTPGRTGDHGAALQVVDSANGSPHRVTLLGSGEILPPPPPAAVAGLQVAPAAMGFGERPIGLPGAPRGLTLASTGTEPLVIRSISVIGADPVEFVLLAEGDGGPVLPGATREVRLQFTPIAAGERGAVLEIRSNAPGSPHRVPLSGAGRVVEPGPLSRDWPVFGHDPRQLGLAPDPLDPRALARWEVALGSRPAPGALLSPVVREGVAYVGTEAGAVFAVDVATHLRRWERPLPAPVLSALAAGAEAVVASASGLYGLSPADGTILWQRPDIVANEDVSPMLAGDTVYIGARTTVGGGAALYAVKAATGANAWPAAPLPAGWESRGTAAVYPELGLLFLGLGSAPSAGAPDSGPSAVMAARLSDGSAAWPKPVLFDEAPPAGLALGWVGPPNGATNTAPALQPAIFLATGAKVTALNAVSGATLWSRTLPEPVLHGPPVLSSGAALGSMLFVGSEDGRVYALDSSTGADLPGGLTAALAPIAGPLALAGSYLYVPTTAGLVAADPITGARLWDSPLTAASGVAVADGMPYVATADGRLVGFGPPAPPPVVVRDLAIERIEVAPRVSRRTGAVVQVTLANRGTAAAEYRLLVRVQPGRTLLLDGAGSLAPGDRETVEVRWPTGLMGDAGPKSVVAQVTLVGATDGEPTNNNALQPVTVGP